METNFLGLGASLLDSYNKMNNKETPEKNQKRKKFIENIESSKGPIDLIFEKIKGQSEQIQLQETPKKTEKVFHNTKHNRF